MRQLASFAQTREKPSQSPRVVDTSEVELCATQVKVLSIVEISLSMLVRMVQDNLCCHNAMKLAGPTIH